MSEKPELKPCPFCGGKAYIGQAKDGEWHINTLCGVDKPAYHSAFVIADTEAEAVEAWNTRAERTCKQERLFNLVKRECDGNRYEWHGDKLPNYCPNCGAKVVQQ